ncbi:hypothetical protein V2J09_013576 [Rumex salicifolius]
METKQRPLSILMLPWLAHGHISPYLELAKKLTTKNFLIYMCSTPANLESVKKKLSVEYLDSIQLVELSLPSLPELPPHYHTTNGLPLHLMSTLKEAFDMASEPGFSNILESLRPDLLVYDYLQPWAPALANSYNIPAVEFITFSPTMMSFYHHFCGDFPDSDQDYPFLEIYMTDYERVALQNIKVRDNGGLLECMMLSSKIVLFKTFRQIEGKYLDYLEASIGKRMLPAGPLVEDPNHQNPDDEFTRWLDEKQPLSTVFVSFGSEYYCSDSELEEIALGLELSKVSFIWVIRFPAGEDKSLHQVLPNGFLERVKERGLVVERWAPQMRILGHPSIGGFVSHCGISSMVESLKLGLPIIAMPMHLDQPVNARLVVSLGLAMEVKRDSEGRYRREEIARVIKEVMVKEVGKDLRRKAKEMSSLVVKKGDEEIDVVAKELVQLCEDAEKI